MPPLLRFLALIIAGALCANGSPFPADRLDAIDDAIRQAVTDARTPGAVFRMERDGTVYQKAFGDRAVVPKREPMTEDTIFDAASLTKVIATNSAVMKLVETGKIDVEAPVIRYLPEFSGGGKEAITIRQLLTHSSALRGGLPPGAWTGKAGALATACALPPSGIPGATYRYSDINFILLGLVVEKVAGVPLDAFCTKEIFAPLRMTDTRFGPITGPDLARVAPTTVMANGVPLRGIVHDPTSRRMGGVAGHAGLFTTAADLGRFGQMMLNLGEFDGVRVFQPETVRKMTTVQSPPGLPRRGFGWDIDSPYAGPRGALFPIGSYGHTGWTGTRIWIDPFSRTVTILLSNRNHPDERGNVIPLQREIGTLAAEAVPDFDFAHVAGALPIDPATAYSPRPSNPNAPVLNGIDVLKRDNFRQLRGRRIGLVTNQTGIDREGNTTIDLLRAAPGLKLVALFSPEHGIRGEQDQSQIADSIDEKSGLPIHSLYGENRAPTPAQLADIDTLVFDIQDIGCRFYTYISTMDRCLEAAAKAGKRFVVLDRANPLGPLVEGPVSTGKRSFVATFPLPLRHGMTVGEIARLIDRDRNYRADLGVIRCEGGSPLRWLDETGLPWKNPSPNMRSLTAAILYPGVGLQEFCKVSVGRGTESPFEILGAPYLDGPALAAELNRAALPGVRFEATKFTPASSVFAGQECSGVRISLIDRNAFRAADLGILLATTLHRLHPAEFNLNRMVPLLSDEETLAAIRAGQSPDSIRKIRDRGLKTFLAHRSPALLYPR